MAETDLGNVTTTNLDDGVDKWIVDQATTDGPDESKETYYTNSDWSEQYGYYKNVPIARAKINARARWTVGKGFEASDFVMVLLSGVNGIGIDTFNTILENMIRVMHVGGDSFAEIIRDEKTNLIINLKPLDPSSIRIVANRKGIIIRYDKIAKTGKKLIVEQSFQPEEIFHLSRDRVADEIHGQSLVSSIKKVLDFKEELYENWKIVMQRNVWPLSIFEVDHDDTTKLNTLKEQYKEAINKKEVLLVPKGTVIPQKFGQPPNATLNALPTLEYLDGEVDRISEVPAIISGGAKNVTESSTKIEYLAWQQTVEEDQLYIEEQVSAQLGLTINLVFPASLQNELLSDKQKDVQSAVAQPNELTAGRGQ